MQSAIIINITKKILIIDKKALILTRFRTMYNKNVKESYSAGERV